MADSKNPRPLGDPLGSEDDNIDNDNLDTGEFNHRMINADDAFDDELGLDAEDEDDYFADDLDNDLGDDLDDDDLDDDDPDLEEGELTHLREHFQADDYRIASLSELAALDDIEDEVLAAVTPTLSLEEVLYNLVREAEEVAINELAVFSDLAPADVEQVRRVWPQAPLLRRVAVVSSVGDLFGSYLGLNFGAFLRLALDDADADVRRFAVLGLAQEGAAVDLLGRYVQLLQSDEDVEVRAAAATALGAYILDGELEELDSAMAMRAEQVLVGVLTDSREASSVQCRALESIAYSGELGIRQLIEEAYYSPQEEKRLSALVAMGRSADVRWRRLARAELTNPDAAMRAQAAIACGELETRSALSGLLRLLGDRQQLVRLAAMYALGHIGGPEARRALQAVVESSNNESETLAAEQALEEMDFYAGGAAAAAPLFDEADADDDSWDAETDWDDRDEDNDDLLGEYE